MDMIEKGGSVFNFRNFEIPTSIVSEWCARNETPAHIASIGCGKPSVLEVRDLCSFVGDEVVYYGFDKLEFQIEEATLLAQSEYYHRRLSHSASVNFQCIDLEQESINVGTLFDLIYLKSPGPLCNKVDVQKWQTIISKGLDVLRNGGLIMTSHFLSLESRYMEDILKSLGITDVLRQERRGFFHGASSLIVGIKP